MHLFRRQQEEINSVPRNFLNLYSKASVPLVGADAMAKTEQYHACVRNDKLSTTTLV